MLIFVNSFSKTAVSLAPPYTTRTVQIFVKSSTFAVIDERDALTGLTKSCYHESVILWTIDFTVQKSFECTEVCYTQ